VKRVLIWITGNKGTVTYDEDGDITGGNGFAFHGIDTTNCATLPDDRVIKHHTQLTAEQLRAVHGDMSFTFLSDEEIAEIRSDDDVG
jgi:hypothetical protein